MGGEPYSRFLSQIFKISFEFAWTTLFADKVQSSIERVYCQVGNAAIAELSHSKQLFRIIVFFEEFA
jgi:hypothetical protein